MKKQKYSAVFLILMLILVDLFIIVAFRVRTYLIMHIFGLAIGFIYLSEHLVLDTEKVQFKSSRKLLRLVLLGIVIAFLGVYVRFARGLWETAESLQDLEVDIEYAVSESIEGGDFGYAPHVFEVMRLVPDRYDHLNGQSYYRLFFITIPRSLWQDKPPNTQRIVASWIRNTPGQTIPPGIQGDLYINFGIWGVWGFIVYGFIFAKLDRTWNLHNLLTLSVTFPVVFHLVRGGFTNPILLFITITIGNAFVCRFISKSASKTLPDLRPASPLYDSSTVRI